MKKKKFLYKITMITILLLLFVILLLLAILWVLVSRKRYFLHESFDSPAAPFYPSDVVLNSLDEIENVKMEQPHIVVLLVYDDHCPHCQNFKPTWRNLIDKYNQRTFNNMTYYFYQAGNSNPNTRNAIEQKYHIQGYPTLLISKNNEPFTEYTNMRDFATICSYLDSL